MHRLLNKIDIKDQIIECIYDIKKYILKLIINIFHITIHAIKLAFRTIGLILSNIGGAKNDFELIVGMINANYYISTKSVASKIQSTINGDMSNKCKLCSMHGPDCILIIRKFNKYPCELTLNHFWATLSFGAPN